MTEKSLAEASGVPESELGEIVRGERGITDGVARQLARATGTTVEFWLNLQTRFDRETARDASVVPAGRAIQLPGRSVIPALDSWDF